MLSSRYETYILFFTKRYNQPEQLGRLNQRVSRDGFAANRFGKLILFRKKDSIMEQSINRKNRFNSVRPTHWIANLFFQFVIACACLPAFAQEDKKEEPSQAQPDSGSGEKEPNAGTEAKEPSEPSPETQTPPEQQPPSEPKAEQQPPSEPQPAQQPPSEPSAPAGSDAASAEETKPASVETAPSKPKATPSDVAKPTAPRPQKTDSEEGRRSPAQKAPIRRAGLVCANGRPAVENERSQWPPVRINGELGFLASRNWGATSTWLSPLLGGWFRVSDMVAISADWGFAMLNWSVIEGISDTDFRMGNPFLAVHSVRQHGCTELRVGIGATVPLAFLQDSGDERRFTAELYRGAMAMRGMWNWWLWVPDSMSVALPVSWETAASTNWIFGGEIALASTVFFEGHYTEFLPVDVSLQALLMIPFMGKVGYRIDPFILSIQLHAVWVVNDGAFQTAATPGARLNLGTGYVEARFNLNLDKPFGIGADRPWSSKLWGFHLGGGVEF
jgi:hypothetical protein